jgi:flagellar biosynthesis/type III secretory pathway protein FliH
MEVVMVCFHCQDRRALKSELFEAFCSPYCRAAAEADPDPESLPQMGLLFEKLVRERQPLRQERADLAKVREELAQTIEAHGQERYEQGLEEGYLAGYQKGQEDGRQEALKQSLESADELLRSLQEPAPAVDKE